MLDIVCGWNDFALKMDGVENVAEINAGLRIRESVKPAKF